MKRNKHTYFSSKFILTVVAICVSTLLSHALPAEHYASKSALADGKWAKIKVESTGMHLISTADLRALGFTDPSKVNVYGTGGQMVSEIVMDTKDDLPLLPCVRTSKGILFFAVDNVKWSSDKGLQSHNMNPYCGESYYFISDRDVEPEEMKKASLPGGSASEKMNQFRARMLYETDLINPAGYGRRLLGEDFRSQKSRTFKFNLADKASNNIESRVCFVAKTVNGSSSVVVKVNDKQLTVTPANQIPGTPDDFYSIATINNSFEDASDMISLTLDYTYSGVIYLANLDYIELFYDRELKLNNGELHFYSDFDNEEVEISGCTGEVLIWDVTDPTAPLSVEFSKDGDKARFRAPLGYREYVAFDPAVAGSKIVKGGKVYNQNIHGSPSPDMVIIAYPKYRSAAERIAEVHRKHDAMTVEVLSPEAVYNEFSGGHTDVSAFRKLLKMWYDRPGGDRRISHCLLLGRGSYDTKMVTPAVKSAGYTPLPLWQSSDGMNEEDSYSTDDIIGMIDDEPQNQFDIASSKIRVAVGRLPVTSEKEANDISTKIENYVNNATYGAWRNRVMLIADDQNRNDHLNQSEDVYEELYKQAPHYRYEKVYLDSYELKSTSVGLTYPDAKDRMLRTWNEGVVFTNYIGHASQNSWTHEKLMTWNDMVNISNKNLTFLCASTCKFGHWDGDDVSGAEMMTLNPNAGFIGTITPSRTVYIGLNGPLNYSFSKYFLTDRGDGKNYTFGEAFIKGKNEINNKNKLRFCLIADPALRIPKPGKRVEIESFNGVNLENQEDLMVLPAYSKVDVKGSIRNLDGSKMDGFNGFVQLDLYDAEKAVETLGNGSEGESTVYNDRTVKLSSVSTAVYGGDWSTTLFVPAEIENNYSPAKLLAYAWEDNGEEAHGSNDKFYVYGYNEGNIPDTIGPKFEYLYLNYVGQTDGCSVNATPVLHASLDDESGINLSDAGIGHKMNISVDGKTILEDVVSYYMPDPERPTGGTVVYPLPELSAGDHTITFTVYDNANNSSKKDISFNVATTRDPLIMNLYTDVNPAKESVVFNVEIDTPNSTMKCCIEVFDLMGKRVWVSDETQLVNMNGVISKRWNLCDSAGRRVPRGIYLYRARVETLEGRYSSQTKKLAVAAE